MARRKKETEAKQEEHQADPGALPDLPEAATDGSPDELADTMPDPGLASAGEGTTEADPDLPLPSDELDSALETADAPKPRRALGGEYRCDANISLGGTIHRPGEIVTLTDEEARHFLSSSSVIPLD